MFTRVLLGGLMALALAVPPAPAAQWLSYSEPDFDLYGDASRRQVADVIQNMQVYRYARDAVLPKLRGSDVIRPRVFVLSGSTFAKYAGTRRNVAGFVSSSDFGVDIVVDASCADWTGTSSTIQHELTHYYLHQSSSFALPVWYDEGLAEYLSTIDISKGKLRVGFPAAARWVDLQELSWMPLREMFKVSRGSEAYTGHRGARVFYAQSWLLTHYLLSIGGEDARAVGLMVAHIDQGSRVDDAIQAAFGDGFAAFEERVRKYARPTKFRIAQLDKPDLPDLRTRIVEIDEARAMNEMLMFGMRGGRHEDPNVRALAARLSEDPANGHAAAAQAFLLRAAGGWQTGLDPLARCSQLRDDDAALVLCGDAWMAPASDRKGGPAATDEQADAAARKAAELYERAWRLNPDNYEAINSMAMVYRHGEQDGARLQRELRSAIARFPRSSELRVQLAGLQAGTGDLPAARQTLERVLLDSNDPTWRLHVIRRLRDVENEIAAQAR